MPENVYTDGSFLKNNPSWSEENTPWKAKYILQLMRRNNLNPINICEIGCGSGGILVEMSRILGNGIQFYGYEISPQAFAICSKKATTNVKFFLSDALQDNTTFFDLVMAIDVIEHVEDVYGFLRKLKEKGAYKIFHIPLELSALNVIRKSPIMKGRKSVGHIHYFTKETALATLEETGYEIIDCLYTPALIELPHNDWRTKFLKLPRKLLSFYDQDLAVRTLGGFSFMVLTK